MSTHLNKHHDNVIQISKFLNAIYFLQNATFSPGNSTRGLKILPNMQQNKSPQTTTKSKTAKSLMGNTSFPVSSGGDWMHFPLMWTLLTFSEKDQRPHWIFTPLS